MNVGDLVLQAQSSLLRARFHELVLSVKTVLATNHPLLFGGKEVAIPDAFCARGVVAADGRFQLVNAKRKRHTRSSQKSSAGSFRHRRESSHSPLLARRMAHTGCLGRWLRHLCCWDGKVSFDRGVCGLSAECAHTQALFVKSSCSCGCEMCGSEGAVSECHSFQGVNFPCG